MWDNNSGNTNIIAIDSLVLSTILVGLTEGYNYNFKVCAKNIYGYGPFSDVFTIKASEVPDTMNTVSTAQVF